MGVVAAVEAEGFAGVELEEVDALAYVGVGLGVVLADLERKPGAELIVALLDELRGAQEEIDTLLDGSVRPGGEGGEGGVHCGLSVGGVGGLMEADELRGPGGVGAADLGRGLEAFAADDEVVLAAEIAFDEAQGILHFELDGGVGEVEERLIAEVRERHGGGHQG